METAQRRWKRKSGFDRLDDERHWRLDTMLDIVLTACSGDRRNRYVGDVANGAIIVWESRSKAIHDSHPPYAAL